VKAQLQQQKLLGFFSVCGCVVVFVQSYQDLAAKLEQKQQQLALLNSSLRSPTCLGVISPTCFAGIIYGAGRFDVEVGDLGKGHEQGGSTHHRKLDYFQPFLFIECSH